MKIAIAGYGLEGESNYKYWASNQINEITIVDEKQPDRELPPGVPTIIGQDVFSELGNFDMVVRTAGLAPRKIKTNGKIWSATNEFFSKCPAQIIGVTGSKGKGTTASLIAGILSKANKKVWLVGNIGNSALDILNKVKDTDIVVYELSSFQLCDLEKSPNIAVVLFIEQEHLDVHLDMAEYVNAKLNITKYQTGSDKLVFYASNQYAKYIADNSRAEKIEYPSARAAHVSDNYFYYGEQKICSTGVLKIIGKFNYDNACAAISAIWGILGDDIQAIEDGLVSFSGLPHRLQLVREVNSVKYYDDSIATIPGAAIAALGAFNQPVVIILGGSSKGSDFTNLGIELTKHDARAILIGDEAERIAKSCQAAGFTDYEIARDVTMENLVKKASILASPNGVVLLSPACASFGLFKNYADRGEQFQAAVKML